LSLLFIYCMCFYQAQDSYHII